MNKIYRKVWNKALGHWVVASELAHSDSAGGSYGAGSVGPAQRPLASALAVALFGLFGVVGQLHAQTTCTDANGKQIALADATIRSGGTCATDLAGKSGSTGNARIASVITPNVTPSGFAYLDVNSTGTGATATGADALAVGEGATASSINGIAIGLNAASTATGPVGNSSIAIGANATGSVSSGVALGDGARSLVTTKAGSTGGQSAVAIGARSIAQGDGSDDGANESSPTAVGGGATAIADGAVAYGEGATSTAYYGSSLGSYSNASGAGAIALGGGSQATEVGAIAIGGATSSGGTTLDGFASATAANAVAIGTGTVATGSSSVAIGSDATAATANSVALGASSATAAAVGTTGDTINGTVYTYAGKAPVGTISVGSPGAERTITNVAAGRISDTSTDAVNGSQLFATNEAIDSLASDVNTSAIHYLSVNDGSVIASNYNNDGATGVNSIAMGPNAVSAASGSVAIGDSAYNQTSAASPTNQIAIGTLAHTFSGNSIAVGSAAAALGTNSIAFGASASGSTSYAIAIGSGPAAGADATGLGAIAIGSGGGTALLGNPAVASGQHAIAIGQNTTANFTNSVALGYKAAVGSGSSVALGDSASTGATGVNVAIGNLSTANAGSAGGGAVAIGRSNTAFGDGAVAIGDPSYASGTGAFTGGANNIANADGTTTAMVTNMANGAVAIGNGNTAVGQGSIAMGNTSQAKAAGAIALGDTAVSNNADDVALGSKSVTATVNLTPTASINGTTYNFAGASAGVTSVVSVGSVGTERQITNVAAGRISDFSTDAVNGSQLFATNSAITDVATTANKGFNVTTGATGTGTATGTSVSNVAPGGTVTYTAGDNVALTQAGNTVTVTTTPDVSFSSVTTGGTIMSNTGMAVGPNVNLGSTGLTIVDGPSVTTAGVDAGSKVITNVAAGVALTDGVNVSQLAGAVAGSKAKYYSVNSTGGGNENNDGATGSDAIASGKNAAAVGNGSVALGLGAAASNAKDVALGAASTTAAAVGTASTTINGTTYNYAGAAPTSTVSVGSAGNERTITNVAAGRVSGTSTDAVNGSQLFAVDTAITAIGTQATALGVATAADLGGGASYTVAGGLTAPAYVVQGTTYDNVGDALGGVDTNLTTIYGDINNINGGAGIKYFHANSTLADSTPTGTNSVAIGPVANSVGENSVALGNGAVASNLNDVAVGATSTTSATVAVGGATIGGTSYTFAGVTPDGAFSVGSAGHERQVQNVAAGQLSATSTDAVNGSQLFATNQQVTQNTTDIADINAGGGIKYFHANSTGTDSQALGLDSVAIGPNAVANNDGDIAIGSGSLTSAAVDTAGVTINGVNYAFAGTSPTSVLSVGAAGAERQIQNLAAGQVSAGSTDAVNGSQLYSTNQAIDNLGNIVNGLSGTGGNSKYFHANSTAADSQATGVDAVAIGPNSVASGDSSIAAGHGSTASGQSSTAIGDGAQATNDNSVAIGAGSVTDRDNTVSVGSTGDERQITHVAAGTAATDAVNVGQLQQSQAAAQAGSVQYDKNADGSVNNTSVTMDPGGDPAIIHNVGPGVANNDAVNVGQLNQGINTAENWSKAYTDQKFNSINQDLNTIGNRANGGVAAAMAMASLPQAYQPNQSSAGVALGNFHGETGIAVGVSTISESGRYIFKVNATTNTRGDTGVGVGAGVVW